MWRIRYSSSVYVDCLSPFKCYVTYQCDEVCEEPGYDMTSVVRMFAADGRLFVVDVTVARMSRTLCRLLEGPASFAHPVSDVGRSTCEFSHAGVARCRSERASGRTNPAAERNERDTLSCAGILQLPHRDASSPSPLLPYPLRSHRPPIDPNYSHHAPPDVLGRSGTAAVHLSSAQNRLTAHDVKRWDDAFVKVHLHSDLECLECGAFELPMLGWLSAAAVRPPCVACMHTAASIGAG
jgi:hypothetical protein